jgi:hypothetical protein
MKFFYKTSYLNKEVNRTELPLQEGFLALAYLVSLQVMKKKDFRILTQGQLKIRNKKISISGANVTKLFTAVS